MEIEGNKIIDRKVKIGVVGYGQFGEFICKHLQIHFDVTVFSTRDIGGGDLNFVNYKMLGWGKELQDLDYLILSVPFSAFAETCKTFSEQVSEKTIIIDVTSVKVKPIKLMKQYFLNNSILGTHPIFGPQSGKYGIEGLPIVLTNVSVEPNKYLEIKKFLASVFKLNVIEKTADEHDKEMAEVHALSHFIGRALFTMNIKEYDTSTKGYKNLISLKETVGYDTWELYKTIQNANPYTDTVREEFLKTLSDLEMKLRNER